MTVRVMSARVKVDLQEEFISISNLTFVKENLVNFERIAHKSKRVVSYQAHCPFEEVKMICSNTCFLDSSSSFPELSIHYNAY